MVEFNCLETDSTAAARAAVSSDAVVNQAAELMAWTTADGEVWIVTRGLSMAFLSTSF